MTPLSAPAEEPQAEPPVVLGEVRTGLIAHHRALRRAEAEELLGWLVPGGRALSWERPIAHALSAPVITGLDCALALGAEGRRTTRAVGTVSSRAALTAGTILQCSTIAEVRPAATAQRRSWSSYISRPGVVEIFPAHRGEPVAEGFLGEGGERAGVADFGAIGERLARRAQNAPLLEGRAPLLFRWTRLRFAVTPPDGGPGGAPTDGTVLRLGESGMRTLRIREVSAAVPDIAEFCGDLALHDWILTTVIRCLDQLSGAKPERELADIEAIVSRLLHLWMPAARVNTELRVLWSEFERTPGFTRQWESLVARMRDHIALHTAHQLGVLINHEGHFT